MNFSFLKKTPQTRILFFILADIFLISISIIVSFWLRFDGTIPVEYLNNYAIWKIIVWTLLFCLPIFYFFRLYSFSWSYVGAQELASLLKAITLAFLLLGITIFLSNEFRFFSGFPRSVLIISYFLVLIFSGGIRISKRISFIFLGKYKKTGWERTLIVGAGDAGEQILRSIVFSKNSPYNPVAIVDDSRMKQGVSIHGLRVVGRIIDIPRIIASKEIKQVIVALPSAGNKIIKEVVELARKSGVHKIKVIPALSEIIAEQVSFKNLKDVDPDDLLGRDQVTLNTKDIEQFIKNRTVLVTGAAGSIGSELCMQIAMFEPASLILFDQDETGIFNISNSIIDKHPSLKIASIVSDITDEDKVTEIFKRYNPEIVLHAAAYKHVPLMEENPSEAVKNNILGTKIVAETSIKYNVEKFILISTDKAINPTSVMGATKRVAEMVCQGLNQKNKTKFISVRFGNVLDSRGSVIPIFREQIKKGGPIEVTHPDMKRYFMLIPEACILVLQAGAMGKGGEVFVLDMGQPVKILDLAKEMIKLSGYEPDKDIAIVFTGIRPGEKLFEEMLTEEEKSATTRHKKIFKASLTGVDSSILDKEIDKLISLAKGGDEYKIKEELKSIISNKKSF